MKKIFIINASDKSLGSLINFIVKIVKTDKEIKIIKTKNNIVIMNTNYIKYTGKKKYKKIYYRHSGYPGGLKKINLENFLEKGEKLFKRSLKGVTQKNKLYKNSIKKIKFIKNYTKIFNIKKPKIITNDAMIL